jgi:hypothetical protein
MARASVNTTVSLNRVDSKSMSEAQIYAVVEKMGDEVKKQQRVPVRLPVNVLDPDNNEPQYVCVNGYSFYIPRGKTVMLPMCVARLLRQQNVI